MNRFCDLVGCRLPLQLAPMSGTVTPELAAAVSNAGGLGMLAAGRRGADVMIEQIEATARLTGATFGCGFIVEFLDRDVLDAVAARVPIIEFFWGWPDPAVVPADRLVAWQVGTVDEAVAAVDAGCAYVIAQGAEAGGHVRDTLPLADLLPAVRAAVDVPIVAAGGIGTAAHVRAALRAGADAVRIGTRFVAAEESAAHPRYVELLTDAGDGDTVLTEAFGVKWPDAPHRVLASALSLAEASPEVVGTMPGPDGTVVDIPRFFVSSPTRDVTGAIDAMALYAGIGSTGAVTGRQPAAAIIDELLDDVDLEGIT